MITKRCTKCGQLKPLSEYYFNTGAKDGHRPDCKECYGKPRLTQPQKFWNYVLKSQDNDCWIWTRSNATNNGYGRFWLGKKHIIASRYAYEITYGAIPDGLEVCHSCDNPICVNPNHLYLGTHKQNMNDAYNKGRLGGFVAKGYKRETGMPITP